MLKAPFPWFGGKSLASDLVWSRFGTDIGNYVEPFFGTGAVWHNRPTSVDCWSVVNDMDGNIANVWRSMKHAPELTAEYATHPVNEADLHARHVYLIKTLPSLVLKLMADPDYYDAKSAGWYIWGACQWIGSGWCSGSGPWWPSEVGEDLLLTKNGSNGGQGVSRKLPHLGNGGVGVSRKLPHLGDGGQGVSRKLPHLGNGGVGTRLAWATSWFKEFAISLENTRVACGDWERICSVGTITRNGTCAVLLDPPYSQTDAVYAYDSSTVSSSVRDWCKANGLNPKLRIALCGHDGEHNELEALGWSVSTWTKMSGYSGKKDDRERIWFSPHCLK